MNFPNQLIGNFRFFALSSTPSFLFYLKVIQEFIVNKNELNKIMECKRPNLLSFQVHVKILNILLCIFLFFALRKSSVILIFIGNSTGNVIKVPCYNFLIHLIFFESQKLTTLKNELM